MTAKEYLSQYRECVEDIKCKREELEILLSDATSMSPPTDSGTHTPGAISDKVGKKGAARADIEREIEGETESARLLRRDIRQSISRVSSGTLRRLLTYRYICGCTWERVAVKLEMSYVHVVHRLHPKALNEIGDIIFKNNPECN
jgi:hypothetical protein